MMKQLFLALVAIAFTFSAPTLVQAQEEQAEELLRVVSFKRISTKPFDKSVLDIEYEVTVENNSNVDLSGVFVTFSSDSDQAQVLESKAEIGALNAFSPATSTDTVTVRADQRGGFKPTILSYTFDNDTVEGIDLDGDGLRDDINFFLSSIRPLVNEYEFSILQRIAVSNGVIIMRVTDEAALIDSLKEGTQAFLCLGDASEQANDYADQLKALFLNTEEREVAFINANRIINETYAEEIVAAASSDLCQISP